MRFDRDCGVDASAATMLTHGAKLVAMVTGVNRYQLSPGAVRRRATKITTWAILGPIMVCLSGVAGSIIAVITGAIADISTGALNRWAAIGAGIAMVAATALLVHRITALARTGAWLEGSRLTVRRIRTRTVDLASARWVELSAHTEIQPAPIGAVDVPVRTPVLSAGDGSTTVHLRLRNRDGGLLPPHEMRALADAVSAADCPGAPDAVSWLRAIAADPRSLFS